MKKPELKNLKNKEILDYIEYLENSLQIIFDNKYMLDCYLSVTKKITEWNEQLNGKKIDILDSDNKTVFEMVHKYFTELKYYIELANDIKNKLTPEQKRELEEVEDISGLAEKFANG